MKRCTAIRTYGVFSFAARPLLIRHPCLLHSIDLNRHLPEFKISFSELPNLFGVFRIMTYSPTHPEPSSHTRYLPYLYRTSSPFYLFHLSFDVRLSEAYRKTSRNTRPVSDSLNSPFVSSASKFFPIYFPFRVRNFSVSFLKLDLICK